jgi:hypothetical protein
LVPSGAPDHPNPGEISPPSHVNFLAILFWFSKFGDVNSIFVFTSSAFVEIIIESKTSCVIIKHHLRITPLSTKKKA